MSKSCEAESTVLLLGGGLILFVILGGLLEIAGCEWVCPACVEMTTEDTGHLDE